MAQGKNSKVGLSVLLSLVFSAFFLAVTAPAPAQGGYDTSEAYGDASKPEPEEVVPGVIPPGQEDEQQMKKPEFESQNTKPEPFEVNDVQKWFNDYDDIRSKYETTPQESRFANYLMAKPPGSGLTEEEAKFLTNLGDRYVEALNKMQELENCSETERLHRGYMRFLGEQAAMFQDYFRILTEPQALSRLNGRPLINGMQMRKASLQMIERSNRQLDQVTRQTFKITRNPYQYGP